MSIRNLMIATSAAGLAVSMPAAAHDPAPNQQRHDEEVVIVDVDPAVYEGEWQGHWTSDEAWEGIWHGTYTSRDGQQHDARYRGTFIGESRFISDEGHMLQMSADDSWQEAEGDYEVQIERRRRRHSLGASPDGRLAYTMAEREAWLSDCRLLMADAGGYYDYDRRDTNGGLLGGLLGAVVGGVAGNRIADGDRVAGTIVGAGLGGLAGAAIGTALDSDGDGEVGRNEIWAARYCEAYLRRYEMGGHSAHHGGAYVQPVMLVPATVGGQPRGHHGHRHGPQCTVTVREEWIDAPEPSARRAIPPRRPAPTPQPVQQGKVLPIG